MEHHLCVLLGIFSFFLSIHQLLAHPQCLDSRPPFDAYTTLPFCPEYSTFGCCTSADDVRNRIQYEDLSRKIPAKLWSKCSSYVKTFLCQSCSPYAAHIFEAEVPTGVDEVLPRVFPGLCRNYCQPFYTNCKEIVDYLIPQSASTNAEKNKLANTSALGMDAFCNSVTLADNDYCYPELLSNSILNGNISISQVTKEGCICVEEFASKLKNPILARHANDGSQRLFIGEQIGLVHIYYPNGTRNPVPFLNITKNVLTTYYEGDERGFLGMAFHPNFKVNGKFYVYFSTKHHNTQSGNDHKIRISEYQVLADDNNRADISSDRLILEIDEPYWNHNGGEILFGNDTFLYLFVGDGGQGGDPLGSGQNLRSRLGKVLRIDVDTYTNTTAYGIPSDNPFADGQHGFPEIYAYGVRNIWRCGMDRGDPVTGYGKGRIICGDVGQNRYEELDLLIKGANYGWNGYEGYECYKSSVCSKLSSSSHNNLVDPIHAYPHSVGKSVTGGHFYRGCNSPNLNGFYIYGDFMSGRLFRLVENQETGVWENKEIQMCGPDRCTAPLTGLYHSKIISFGEDEDGEVYMLSTTTASPALNHGSVYKIVDPARRGHPEKCRSARPGGITEPPTTTAQTSPRQQTEVTSPETGSSSTGSGQTGRTPTTGSSQNEQKKPTSGTRGPRMNYLDYYRRQKIKNRLREQKNRKQKDTAQKAALTFHGITIRHCTSYPKFWCAMNRLVGRRSNKK